MITGRRPGRRHADDITCFESLGLAIQDIIVGARLLPFAHAQELGFDLPVGI
ncbi:alanine dehydrogenase [Mycobacteroides abscessus subsp. abscessus]|nr:alanine dehydrogenase [Mycobacteroides abscessus subsp. abscessus]